MKTKEIINAYNIIKEIKVGSLNDEVALAIWKNVKAFRPIVEEYDKSVEEAKKSLNDDELKAMSERAQKFNEKTKEYQNGNLPEELQKEKAEIEKFFISRNAKAEKYFAELGDAEVDIDVQKVEETEMLKALKENGKTFEDMTALEWLLK